MNPTKMKTSIDSQLLVAAISRVAFSGALALAFIFGLSTARADETCSSPYLASIDGQEEFVYVWTLGVEGLGDGMDKLVTVDVKPGSPTYGKVVSSSSVEGRNGRTTADSPTTAGSGSRVSIPARSLSSMCIPIRRNRS